MVLKRLCTTGAYSPILSFIWRYVIRRGRWTPMHFTLLRCGNIWSFIVMGEHVLLRKMKVTFLFIQFDFSNLWPSFPVGEKNWKLFLAVQSRSCKILNICNFSSFIASVTAIDGMRGFQWETNADWHFWRLCLSEKGCSKHNSGLSMNHHCHVFWLATKVQYSSYILWNFLICKLRFYSFNKFFKFISFYCISFSFYVGLGCTKN